ncbi:MAG: AAA family ATPase [Bacillota bacterium]
MAIKVLIADDVEETRHNLRRLLELEADIVVIDEAANGLEALEKVKSSRPDVVLMDVNMPEMDGIAATDAITFRYPQIAVIIISVQGENEYLKKAMVAGAKDYLVKPFSGEELASAVRKAAQVNQRLPAVQPPPNTRGESQVITIFSTKGGVGKTTIAVNLAVALKQMTRKSVVLVDLDLQFGDVSTMLNITPQKTLAQLAMEQEPIDSSLVENYLISHSDSGIKILPAPLRPEQAELVNARHVEQLIRALAETYHYVIIDTPPYFNDTNLTALDLSTQILLLMSLDLPTVKNTKLSMRVLESLQHREKVRVVLNRATEEFGIRCTDVERTLGIKVEAQIPSSGKCVVMAVNKGVPFILSSPGVKISQNIFQLATSVAQYVAGKKDEKRGMLARMFSI